MLRYSPLHHVPPVAAGSAPAAYPIASRTPAQLAESRAHQRVFLSLSGRYEEHCRRSRLVESSAVCEAAQRFRRDRNLTSLIAFADLLDQLEVPARAARRRPQW